MATKEQIVSEAVPWHTNSEELVHNEPNGSAENLQTRQHEAQSE